MPSPKSPGSPEKIRMAIIAFNAAKKDAEIIAEIQKLKDTYYEKLEVFFLTERNRAVVNLTTVMTNLIEGMQKKMDELTDLNETLTIDNINLASSLHIKISTIVIDSSAYTKYDENDIKTLETTYMLAKFNTAVDWETEGDLYDLTVALELLREQMKSNIAKLTKPSFINNFLKFMKNKKEAKKAEAENRLVVFQNGVEAKNLKNLKKFIEDKKKNEEEEAKKEEPSKLRL